MQGRTRQIANYIEKKSSEKRGMSERVGLSMRGHRHLIMEFSRKPARSYALGKTVKGESLQKKNSFFTKERRDLGRSWGAELIIQGATLSAELRQCALKRTQKRDVNEMDEASIRGRKV